MNVNSNSVETTNYKSYASTAKLSPKRPIREQAGAKVKLIIPKEVDDKIKYLCRKINSVEWSGILFHTAEGDITKPSEMVITLRDVYLMDIGTGAATDFEYDPDTIVSIFSSNPEFMDYRMALIHSHVNMGVFFSGTDTDELQDNAGSFDFYLSLIVNNAGNRCAKVAFVAKEEKKSSIVTKFKNTLLEMVQIAKEESSDEEVLITIDCEIFSDEEPAPEFSQIDERIKQIQTKKAEEKKKYSTYTGGRHVYPESYYEGYYDDFDDRGYSNSKYPYQNYNSHQRFLPQPQITKTSTDTLNFILNSFQEINKMQGAGQELVVFETKSFHELLKSIKDAGEIFKDDSEYTLLYDYISEIININVNTTNPFIKTYESLKGEILTEGELVDCKAFIDIVMEYLKNYGDVTTYKDEVRLIIELMDDFDAEIEFAMENSLENKEN